MNETNLMLGVAGLPPESARNCVQELTPIPNGEFKKSINGDLLFLETSERKRYKSIITCKDVNSPLADGIWVGSQIMVGCIQNLWQAINPGEMKIRLIRPAVKESICAVNNFGDPIKFKQTDNEVELYNACEEKIFVCFRPWLAMRVIDFSLETDEWGMSGGWKLILEEV
ncbi:MAG: hypothetical protein LBS23_02710 [Holosporaceae bacterium]|jgi:hypothetical protein|nr:hypothetical protein [Holosporaceae bacterium]